MRPPLGNHSASCLPADWGSCRLHWCSSEAQVQAWRLVYLLTTGPGVIEGQSVYPERPAAIFPDGLRGPQLVKWSNPALPKAQQHLAHECSSCSCAHCLTSVEVMPVASQAGR